MSYELTGKLEIKEETKQVSDKFKKRDFIVLKEENNSGQIFTDNVKFQLTQDKCDLLNDYNVGDEIKVSFNVRGNKWEKEGKISYFTNLDAWRIEKASNELTNPYPQDEPVKENSAEEDDLPF